MRRSPGKNLYEQLENKSFAKPPFLQIAPRSGSLVALHLACHDPNQSSAFFCRGDKFRTAYRARTAGRAAESASTSSLSPWNAEGRRSAQSSKRRCLRGILDSRRGRGSFVRRHCEALFLEAATLFRRRRGTTRVRGRQSSGSNCLQRSASL